MLSVSRPIEVVVLNCWVMQTNETLCSLEYFDNPGEVGERAGQPVDLVDDDHVDDAASRHRAAAAAGRALHDAAGEAAVVVAVGDEHPAFVLLALDVGERRLALGVEGVELHLEAFFRRLAGVDGAAELADGSLHFALRDGRSAKNAGPFQRVPVIARAIADSDLYGRP